MTVSLAGDSCGIVPLEASKISIRPSQDTIQITEEQRIEEEDGFLEMMKPLPLWLKVLFILFVIPIVGKWLMENCCCKEGLIEAEETAKEIRSRRIKSI